MLSLITAQCTNTPGKEPPGPDGHKPTLFQQQRCPRAVPMPGGDKQRLERHGTNAFCDLGPQEILGLLGTTSQPLTPKASLLLSPSPCFTSPFSSALVCVIKSDLL